MSQVFAMKPPSESGFRRRCSLDSFPRSYTDTNIAVLPSERKKHADLRDWGRLQARRATFRGVGVLPVSKNFFTSYKETAKRQTKFGPEKPLRGFGGSSSSIAVLPHLRVGIHRNTYVSAHSAPMHGRRCE